MSTALMNLEAEEKLLDLEIKRFELEQRRSMALSKSAFFPDSLKGDVASAVIIYDLAQRMNISVMEVAQSIYIIYNRPSFSTNFLVARLNQSGKIKGALQTVISADKQSAYCAAVDAVTGEKLTGMTYTMQIAKAEGLIDKKGSKWVTMPELMLRKRAQSNFINEFFPEVKFGLQTEEEVIDAQVLPSKKQIGMQSDTQDLNAMLQQPKQKEAPAQKAKTKAPVAQAPKDEEEEEKDLLDDITVEAYDPRTGEVYKPNMALLDGVNADGTDDDDDGFPFGD
jgi:hypothetical protein